MEEILAAMQRCLDKRKSLDEAASLTLYREYEESKMALETALNAHIEARVKAILERQP